MEEKPQHIEKTYTWQEYRALEAENKALTKQVDELRKTSQIAIRKAESAIESTEKVKVIMKDNWGDFVSGKYLDEVVDNLFIPLAYQQADSASTWLHRLKLDLESLVKESLSEEGSQ